MARSKLFPVTTGTVHQFVLNPHGDADGMIFTCGTEVQFPPHMAAEICAATIPAFEPRLRLAGLDAIARGLAFAKISVCQYLLKTCAQQPVN